MKINAETKYCQTCGIPLDIDYTNLEANQNVEYCDYCLHNGVKLYDFS
ncbi:zinc ribbon domain-containing protein, partial [Parabacteroides goldsteinii]